MDAACPLRVVTALYRTIQRQEGTDAPRHSPDVSLRGAKRRGNLGKAVTFSPGLSCYPLRYCEIAPQGHFLALRAQGATAPLGPRNDNSKPLHARRCRSITGQPPWRSLSAATLACALGGVPPNLRPARRSVSAATDAIGWCVFVGSWYGSAATRRAWLSPPLHIFNKFYSK